MRRALIYLRVSTIHQKESRAGLQSQLKVCKHVARQFKISKTIIFEDAAVSGFVGIEERAGLSAALIELSKDDIFIVASRDRIARDMFIAIQVERIIEKIGAQCIIASPSPTLKAVYGLRHKRFEDIKAETFRDRIQKTTTKSLAVKKRHSKCTGTIPYGYKIERRSNLLCLNRKEQRIITLVKKLRAEGNSLRTIIKQLGEAGFQSRAKKLFGLTQVVNMLKSQETPHKLIIDRLSPYGYIKSLQGNFEINFSEYEVVQRVKQLHMQGYSLRAILNTTNSQNYRNRAGNKFHLTQIVRILKRVAKNK